MTARAPLPRDYGRRLYVTRRDMRHKTHRRTTLRHVHHRLATLASLATALFIAVHFLIVWSPL